MSGDRVNKKQDVWRGNQSYLLATITKKEPRKATRRKRVDERPWFSFDQEGQNQNGAFQEAEFDEMDLRLLRRRQEECLS